MASCYLGGNAITTVHHDVQVTREASRRVLGLRPFDVQLIGAMILHKGEIAEMRTGEGKTLVAVLPAYLNALSGKGVHVQHSVRNQSVSYLALCCLILQAPETQSPQLRSTCSSAGYPFSL